MNLLKPIQVLSTLALSPDMHVADADCQQIDAGGRDEVGRRHRLTHETTFRRSPGGSARKLADLGLDRDAPVMGQDAPVRRRARTRSGGDASGSVGMTRLNPASIAARTQSSRGHSLKISPHGTDADAAGPLSCRGIPGDSLIGDPIGPAQEIAVEPDDDRRPRLPRRRRRPLAATRDSSSRNTRRHNPLPRAASSGRSLPEACTVSTEFASSSNSLRLPAVYVAELLPRASSTLLGPRPGFQTPSVLMRPRPGRGWPGCILERRADVARSCRRFTRRLLTPYDIPRRPS